MQSRNKKNDQRSRELILQSLPEKQIKRTKNPCVSVAWYIDPAKRARAELSEYNTIQNSAIRHHTTPRKQVLCNPVSSYNDTVPSTPITAKSKKTVGLMERNKMKWNETNPIYSNTHELSNKKWRLVCFVWIRLHIKTNNIYLPYHMYQDTIPNVGKPMNANPTDQYDRLKLPQ